MKFRVDVDMIMSWIPCDKYSRDSIKKLFLKNCGKGKNLSLKMAIDLDIPIEDKLWLILRREFIPELQLHDIAIFCWEKIARPIWEKYDPNDKRPHNAVKTKKMWLKGKATDKDLDAAGAAAGEKILKYIKKIGG
jgi:hypothetical protein